MITPLIRTSIPGLKIARNFLQPDGVATYLKIQEEFRKKVLVVAQRTAVQKGTTYLSRQHNLSTDENYQKLNFGSQTFQYFDQYGTKGHSLLYAIGNRNVPDFEFEFLIDRIKNLPEMKNDQDKKLNWNVTKNWYGNIPGENRPKVAGFPLHKDITSNGIATFIYTPAGASVKFFIQHPVLSEHAKEILVPENSLLMMANEARWIYLHTIKPAEVNPMRAPLWREGEKRIYRCSTVMGFHIEGTETENTYSDTYY